MKKTLFICLMFVTKGFLAQSFDIEDFRFCLYSSLDSIDSRIAPKGYTAVSRQSNENPLRDNRWCLKNADSATICTLTRIR